jgi:energy-coupling factor transport system ATP-binding protein
VLDLQDASMRYPTASSPSLAGASLTVAAGELVVVIGPSGGGKSTLLDVVTGAAPRITGGVRSGSVRVGRMVRDHVRETGAGLVAAVFQDPESQVLVGRVAEEVAFGLRHAGVERAQIERRVLAVLDQLAIRHLAARDCRTLSGGELQRVLLAAALVLDPVLLVLDEPTSQVDAASERRFWDAIDAARHERGIGVLVAEHRLSHLRRRADRVVIVEGGRIVADEPSSALPGAVEALVQDGYAGLVPAPVVAGGAPRLVVRVDRLEVGDDVESPRRTLLRGFDLNVPAGSIVTLEGPNGAGKSTLMHAVRGLGDGACVQVDGIRRRDVGSSVQQLAYLSQGAGALLPGRSVRHAIEDTCRRLRIPIAFAHEAVAAAGLADRIDAHPSELSVGERQRLALVAATAHRPAVWLLDEPTRGMDRSSRRWVACHVLAHAAAGGVVVVATHDAALAATIATHRLRLDLRTGPSLVPVQRDRSGNVIVEAAARSAPQEVDA